MNLVDFMRLFSKPKFKQTKHQTGFVSRQKDSFCSGAFEVPKTLKNLKLHKPSVHLSLNKFQEAVSFFTTDLTSQHFNQTDICLVLDHTVKFRN